MLDTSKASDTRAEEAGATPSQEQTAKSASRKSRSSRRTSPWIDYALVVTGGVILSLGYVGPMWSWVAWIGLAPLIALIEGCRTRPPISHSDVRNVKNLPNGKEEGARGPERGVAPGAADIGRAGLTASLRRAAALGLACGLGFTLPGLYWLAPVTVAGYLLLCLYVALYVSLFAAGLSWTLRTGWLPTALAAPVLWVALEWIRGNLFTGFPWLYLAHSQVDQSALVQIVDVTGTAGVSFLVVLVNAALVELFQGLKVQGHRPGGSGERKRKPYLVGGIAVGAIWLACMYGILVAPGHRSESRVATSSSVLRILLIQGNIDTPRHAYAETEDEIHAIDGAVWEKQVRLTRLALEQAGDPKPDLMVWSETLLPGVINYDQYWLDKVRAFVAETGVPLLAGTNIDRRAEDGETVLAAYNSACLFGADGEMLGCYHKRHLVPFGEFVPWPLSLLMVPLTHEGYTPGDARQAFLEVAGHKLALNICYEDVFSGLIRSDVARGAEILVNLTNDGWFARSAELAQHVTIARLRAIETRRPLLRATNTGITAVVGPAGQLLTTFPPEQPMTGIVELPLPVTAGSPSSEPPPLTIYTRVGDLFAILCLLASFLMVCAGWRSIRAAERSAVQSP